LEELKKALSRTPATALLGPRQCGKTTLSKELNKTLAGTFFDLEDPRDVNRLQNPMLTLEREQGYVIVDEVQKKPELFEILRVLVDRPENTLKVLLLGSASPHLMKKAAESLAGRISFVDLSGFNIEEVGEEHSEKLWERGGFPRSYLAEGTGASFAWRNDFIRTFLERDIPQLGINIPAETLRRFWTMVAHYHGQVWNAAEFARSLGNSETAARNYLDILSGSYMVRQLPPWFENMKKRQVKSPKIYIRDSGILHTLLSLSSFDDILGHPKLGASWEGFVVEQIFALTDSRDIYFWATHAGAELDLLLFRHGKRYGFEIKYSDAPKTSKSMRGAVSDLGLEHLYIVCPGQDSYPLDEKISVLAIRDLTKTITATT
jgi:hypothetical protein